MWSRNQRQSAVQLLFRRVWIFILLVAVILAANAVWEVYQKEKGSRAMKVLAESEQLDLSRRQAELEIDITRLSSDSGIEEMLREQYSLARAGEQLIIIVDPPAETPAATTSTMFDNIRHFLWFW